MMWKGKQPIHTVCKCPIHSFQDDLSSENCIQTLQPYALTLHDVYFSCFYCCLLFLEINFFKNFFQKHYQSVKIVWTKIDPDLGPNCLQKLSADDNGRG